LFFNQANGKDRTVTDLTRFGYSSAEAKAQNAERIGQSTAGFIRMARSAECRRSTLLRSTNPETWISHPSDWLWVTLKD